MIADLHIHTTASDGEYSKDFLNKKLSDLGMEYVSFTDHERLSSEGKEYGHKIIGGVEIYAECLGKEIHILGYGFKNRKPMLDFLSDKQKKKKENYFRVLYLLSRKGIKLPSDFFRENKGDIHSLVTFITEQSQHKDRKEAFDLYLKDILAEHPLHIKTSYDEVTDIIRQAGGISVWAHPLKSVSEAEFNDFLDSLKKSGINGLESQFESDKKTEELVKLAFENRLVVTFGSDFHGERKNQSIEDLKAHNIKEEYIRPFLNLTDY